MTDEREARLPRWARDELIRLRFKVATVDARIAEADERAEAARLATNPEGSAVVLNPYGAEIGLGNEARVRFRMPGKRGHAWVDVHLTRHGEVEVMGGEPIAIFPSASNVFRIETTRD